MKIIVYQLTFTLIILELSIKKKFLIKKQLKYNQIQMINNMISNSEKVVNIIQSLHSTSKINISYHAIYLNMIIFNLL